MPGSADGTRQGPGDVHRQHPVTGTVGQRPAVYRLEFGGAGAGGADSHPLIQVCWELVDTVTQIPAVDHDVQRHHPDSEFGDEIGG